MKFPVLATALSLLVAGAAQAVPDVVSYAARVENDAGLFSGTVSATFQLFGAPTGGTELWSENAATIVVIGGDLVHDLGSIEPLDDTVLARDDLFLQVTINGDVLEPRAAIRAVPFALLAKNAEVAARAVVADSADSLGGQSLSSFQFTAGANGGLALAGTAFSIAPNGVTADRIAAAAVSLAKMAANSVDGSKIVDGAVSLAKLAANSIDGSKIVDGAVSLAKMAANSVDGSKIVDGAVSLAKLAANSVDGGKIVDGSVGGDELGAGSVTFAKIATGAVGTTQIFDSSVGTADLANSAVTRNKIGGVEVAVRQLPVVDLGGGDVRFVCGSGLTASTDCETIMCGVSSGNSPLFFRCTGSCGATAPETCAVTESVGFLLAANTPL